MSKTSTCTCIYCGKPTAVTDNHKNPVCENEYVCEEIPQPTFSEEYGKDPLGKNWSNDDEV